MIYILNSLIVPVNFDKYPEARIRLNKISLEGAKVILENNKFISAVGHEGSAQLLSRLLGIPIQVNRISVYFEKGDIGIHFFLKQRLPEGKILSDEELSKLEFWIVRSEVL
jgi:hypothetical protein